MAPNKNPARIQKISWTYTCPSIPELTQPTLPHIVSIECDSNSTLTVRNSDQTMQTCKVSPAVFSVLAKQADTIKTNELQYKSYGSELPFEEALSIKYENASDSLSIDKLGSSKYIILNAPDHHLIDTPKSKAITDLVKRLSDLANQCKVQKK